MTSSTLAATLWPTASTSRGVFRMAVLVVLGVALMTVSAKFRVWIGPVPISMQTFGALVIGMSYGARLGAGTVASYLAVGLAGLLVFAGEFAGPGYVAGPTGGFLIGFVAAAGLVGWLAERGWDRRVSTTLLAMVLGTIVIFACGLPWLNALIGDWGDTLNVGLYPFLYAAVLKIVLAAAVLPGVWALIRRR